LHRIGQQTFAMVSDASIRFFDAQFRRQVDESDLKLNPFEERALPYLQGTLLDYGCGLGNLSLAAARRGCATRALDASAVAIDHLRRAAASESLPIAAECADLRTYRIDGQFDAVVSIGLLMFFDCPTAWRQLEALKEAVSPGGVAIVNVLVQGTTFMDMFAPDEHCLFKAEDLIARFAGWQVLSRTEDIFPAAGATQKVFCTVIARRPHDAGGAASP
jgi:tellurite methyltransferase